MEQLQGVRHPQLHFAQAPCIFDAAAIMTRPSVPLPTSTAFRLPDE